MDYIYTKPNSKIAKRITFFSLPKPFIGHIGVIQYNAILSWTLLVPKAEIVLYGNEKGTAEIAKKLNLIQIPEVKRNEFGTPLLDSVFADIHHRASNHIITYINADIILTDDFLIAVNSVAKTLQDFLIIGRRWNLEIKEKIALERKTLQSLIKQQGYLADDDCKDYFVFPKHLFAKIPSFAVGRGYWDTWMVRKALTENYPVIDASLVITAIHQNHAYTHIRGGKNAAYMGQEATINKALGNIKQKGNIACATWQLKPQEYLNRPKVSVVVVINNYSTVIEKAVLSVLIQKYHNHEIIIIDRSYNKLTKAILEPYQNKISYFSLEEIKSSNWALQNLRGEFVLFLQENNILLPNTLEKQIAYFEAATTIDILLSGYKIVEAERVNEYQPWNNLPNLENLALKQLLSFRKNLVECLVIIRRCRLEIVNIASFDLERIIPIDLVFNLVAVKGCRVDWWQTIAKGVLLD